jgi:hypothetical protein
MGAVTRVPLGAPGIYPVPSTPPRRLAGVRMDVCAFVGVAPRGPVWVPVVDEKWRDDRPCVEPGRPRGRTWPVAVESFDEYRMLFGGFEGPGLLPYAVASFFDQGGQRAYVARIVHDYGDPGANAGRVAAGVVSGVAMTTGPLRLTARNEGSWGNRIRAAFGVARHPLSFEAASPTDLTLAADSDLAPGSLLNLSLPGGTTVLRYATTLVEEGRADAAGTVLRVTFDLPAGLAPLAVEVIEGILLLDDGAGQGERHERLGLSAQHPRWLATVLCNESQIVYPDWAWSEAAVDPAILDLETLAAPALPDADASNPPFTQGADDYAAITPEDFFDPGWTLGDDDPGEGVQALTQLADLSLLVVPDLYSPGNMAPIEPILDPAVVAGATFERCLPGPSPAGDQGVPVGELTGLQLDPRLPEDLRQITALQARLVEFAEQMRSFVVLLDVPPGLSQRRTLAWRASFASAYAAAYHPWLLVARTDDRRNTLVRVPPAAVAAGVIAQREIAFGVPYGPANVLAAGVVDVDDPVSPARHDELHPLGINVYLRERDGIRLTAARTLSRDPDYRQLSVRRLITMLRRVLDREMQWAVFEPNTPALWSDVRQLLWGFLRQLFAAGAFRGATEEEAFFVRCDETVNPPAVVDAGRMIAEVGVAPAEPLEFILLRLVRDGDGTFSVED